MLYRRLHRPLLRAATATVLLLLPLTPAALASPQAGSTHVVQPGETLLAIASAAGVDANALAALNNLADSDNLVAGQSLTLPPSAPTTSTPAAPASSTPAAAAVTAARPAGPKTSVLTAYTVQPGETLSAVARDFGVTTDALVSANGLGDADHIGAGAVLMVPQPAREHVVQDGESLRDVAAQEKVDLGSLVDFNGLADPDLVRPGQVVLVPVPGQVVAASVTLPSAPPAPAPAPAAAATPAPSPSLSPSPSPTPAATTGTPSPTASASPTPTSTSTSVSTSTSTATSASAATPTTTASAATPPPSASPSPAAAPAKTPASPKPGPKLAPAAPAVTGDGLAALAARFVGAPYVWGGTGPAGFDCSGFVFYVTRQAGKSTPRGLLGEFNSGPHPSRDDLKAGDIVFFQNTYAPGLSHAGIYLGGGTFISAADEATGVVVSNLTSGFWASHWFGATRL